MDRIGCILLWVLVFKAVSCQNDITGCNGQDKGAAASGSDPKCMNGPIEKDGLGTQITIGTTESSLFGTQINTGVTMKPGEALQSPMPSTTAPGFVTQITTQTTKNVVPDLHSSTSPTIAFTSGPKTTTTPGIDYPFSGIQAFPKNQPICDNTTLPSERQLLDFRLKHSKPIGLLTLGSGRAVDVTDSITFNSDLGRSDYFYDIQSSADGQRVPERIVHAKGTAAWGFFEVTNDVSNYTHADVFNGIGKKTKVLGRLSVGPPERGVSDLGRDLKGFAMKFYTKEGNLDFINLQTPVSAFKDPIDFNPFAHTFIRNPKTNLQDITALIDLVSLRPHALPIVIYLTSDRGIPDGWRHADFFPIHTFELVNKYGDRWYARFSWRTERGLRNLTLPQIFAIQGITSDYYIRDLYNAIENNNFPQWRLEMDILSLNDIQNVDYNPFDVTRLWKKGTYKTVTVGRLTLNKLSDNQFRDQDQAAFDPTNLVSGIPGPVDALFRGRRFAYRDAQNYRISNNFHKVEVNEPYYENSYKRDGSAPMNDNGHDSPTYYPNSFNGPLPIVDDRRPKEYLQVLETNAVDLQEAADFYEEFAPDEASKDRLGLNQASLLVLVTEPVRTRYLKLLYLINPDLLRRTLAGAAIFQTLLTAAQAGQTAAVNT